MKKKVIPYWMEKPPFWNTNSMGVLLILIVIGALIGWACAVIFGFGG